MARFTPTSNTKICPYTGGDFTLHFFLDTNEEDAIRWDIKYESDNDKEFIVNIKEANTNARTCVMTVSYPENTSTVNKKCTFYLLKFESSSAPKTYIYRFQVAYDSSNTLKPIWEDTYFYENNTVSLDYSIEDEDGNIIYSGKTVAEPNATNISFNINNICKNHLNSHLDNGIEERVLYVYDYAKLFQIKSGNEALAQYRFYNSYAYTDIPTTIFLNDPIKRTVASDTMIIEADRRQYTIVSAFNRDVNPRTLSMNYVTNQGTQSVNYEIDNTAMLVRIGKGFEIPNVDIAPNNLLFHTTEGADGKIQLNAIDTCYEYCLYYCNAFGGWDSLLIKGNVLKTDNIDSQYYIKGYDNKTQEFGKVKYHNKITSTYRLHTDWFTDEEQSRLHHLLESTEVYLHNLNTDKIEPVNITNKTVEYKTFTNNGKKKWHNTIDVEVAQTKIRK